MRDLREENLGSLLPSLALACCLLHAALAAPTQSRTHTRSVAASWPTKGASTVAGSEQKGASAAESCHRISLCAADWPAATASSLADNTQLKFSASAGAVGWAGDGLRGARWGRAPPRCSTHRQTLHRASAAARRRRKQRLTPATSPYPLPSYRRERRPAAGDGARRAAKRPTHGAAADIPESGYLMALRAAAGRASNLTA